MTAPGRRSRRRAIHAVATTTLLLLACNGASPPDAPPADPPALALALFELADGAGEDELADGWLGEAELEQDPIGALEVVAALGEMSSPEVIGRTELEGLHRTAVDLLVRLDGGGTAQVAVQVETRPDGSLRVVAVSIPGRDWPSHPRRGTGLTVSSPVGESR